MRKKIPTITRPDPAYAAALRPVVEEDLGRAAGKQVTPTSNPKTAKAEDHPDQSPVTPSALSTHPCQEDEIRVPLIASSFRTEPKSATRKIDIRVNALERQEEALIDCRIDPAHVVRAALRRAVANWQLEPEFTPPPEEQRTRITQWQARTSLAVDACALTALLREHDPLDVLSKWALVRGQVEPRVWAEIDVLLAAIAAALLNVETPSSSTMDRR